ncbi:MAG: ComF family protein [Colwelliaceae bacterium]|nr:ComF family protein [Colwelliaceae bacterium]
MELDQASLTNYLVFITRKLSKLVNKAHFALSECELCQNETFAHPFLCEHCINDLPLFSYRLLHNNLLNWPAVDKLFPNREFEQLLCLAPYIAPFDHWLRQFKYHQRFELTDLFAFLLERLCESQFKHTNNCALLAVPIHIKKWQQRGFNQTHLIAKALEKKCNLDYLENALRRVDFSDSQVGQSGKLRRVRLKNAFEITNQSPQLPDNVILLDDVITTGSTTNTICRLLKEKGVKHITVLTVALTLPKKHLINFNTQ